jgi:glyoxylate utilization-related uncharacterized protein
MEGIHISLLASKLEHNIIESYCLELQPGRSLPVRPLDSDINGERFIYALKGSIRVQLQGEGFDMKTGDTLNYKSALPCTIRNASESDAATVLLNGTPPVL